MIVKNLAVATMTAMTTIPATTYAMSPVEGADHRGGQHDPQPQVQKDEAPDPEQTSERRPLGSVPMLSQRPAILEDDPDADPGECGEGSDANEGKQEKLPAPGAQEFH